MKCCSVLLCLFCIYIDTSLVAEPVTFQDLARLLHPISYDLKFHILANMSSLEFNYQLDTVIIFQLKKKAPVLILQTTAPYLFIKWVRYNESRFIQYRSKRKGSLLVIQPTFGDVQPGVYDVQARLEGPIGSKHGRGIMYSLHMDSLTKKLTHSIWFDFNPHKAKYVILALSDVNAKSKISTTITHNSLDNYHAYFARQSSFRTLEKNRTRIEMFDIDLPIAFFGLYLSQTVRITKGTPTYSATLTTNRNHVGKFKEPFRYLLDIFYRYVEKYQTFGPKKIPLLFKDVFLHLHPNITNDVLTAHSTCVVSTPHLITFYKNANTLNAVMARCMAANHIMTRRFPTYWDSLYIQRGLLEYYAVFMKMHPDTGERMMDDFSGLGLTSVLAFGFDDSEAYPLIIGVHRKEQSYYDYFNELRMLCFVNMLKHLIPHDKSNTFDAIVSDFLSQQDNYNRSDFMQSYQTVTEYRIFSNDIRINWFFDRWTMQSAYPILTVKRVGQTLTFHQTVSPHFVRLKPKSFMIPINIILEPRAERDLNKTHPVLWMFPNSTQVSFEIVGVTKWYLVNNQRASYFRVFYDSWNYKLVRFELLRGNINKIAPVTRGQILDDLLFFGEMNFIKYEMVLEIMEYLRNEENEIAWQMVDYQMVKFARNLAFTPAYSYFLLFMRVLTRNFYKRQVEQSRRYTRHAIRWACFSLSPRCMRRTNRMLKDFLEFHISYEYMDTIVCQGVKLADDNTMLYIKQSLYHDERGMEHDLYLKAMACSDNYGHLTESLNLLFRTTSVIQWLSPTDKSRHMQRMIEHPEGITAVLDFIFIHPVLVYETLGEPEIRTVLTKMSKSLYRRSHQRKLIAIAKYLKLQKTEVFFKNISKKRMWLDKNYRTIARYLYAFDYSGLFDDD